MYISIEMLIAAGGAIAFIALFLGIIKDCFFDEPTTRATPQPTRAAEPEPEPYRPEPPQPQPQPQPQHMMFPYPVYGGGGGGGYDPQKLNRAMQLLDLIENGNGGRRW